MRLLLTQLYDPSPEVAELAARFLEDVCEDIEMLELVVKLQPILHHLGDVGHSLLLKCGRQSSFTPSMSNCSLGSCPPHLDSSICTIPSISTVKWIYGFM